MTQIINVRDYCGLEKSIEYIHGIWGSERNYLYYYDAIINSSLPGKPLPRFFILLKSDRIIGCSALITNDFISRHDLYPWLACLFVDEKERGQSYGRLLIEYALSEAKSIGFSTVYLTTDHDGYYEKYGWQRIEDGYDLFTCKPSRIYTKTV
jgi:GNAT superfamily N-acetyltransferase